MDSFSQLSAAQSNITHPGNATKEFVYEKLDLAAGKPRDNRWFQTLIQHAATVGGVEIGLGAKKIELNATAQQELRPPSKGRIKDEEPKPPPKAEPANGGRSSS